MITTKLELINLSQLDQFLISVGTMSMIELHGFLSAVISGPKLIMPNEWMDIAGVNDIEFDSDKEAQLILSGIMDLYSDIVEQFTNQTYRPLLNLATSATSKK